MNRLNPFLVSILLIMTCLSGLGSYAQQRPVKSKADQFQVVHWDKDNGLAINTTNVMFKDADGFLWIGNNDQSSSIYRFDGVVFKRYAPEDKKTGAINSGAVYSFKSDSLHNVWVGTEKGMSRYDNKADTFSNFSPLFDSPYQKATIAPFWATRDEIYCMEPGAWITAIDIRTFKRRKLVKISKEVSVQAGQWNTNKSIFEAASGSFWALAYYEGQQVMGLVQIFLNGMVVKYPWPCHRNHTGHPHGHDAEDMEYDAVRNSIWINSSDGLLEFSLRDKKFHPIATMYEYFKRKDYERGVGITIDKKNRILFSTWSDGILAYDPKTNQVEPLLSDPDLQKRIGEFNLHIYFDPDGIGWTSNWSGGGIYQLLPINSLFTRYYDKPSTKDSLSSSTIYTIVRGPKGKLWMGTPDGINVFDPGTEKFEVLREKDFPGLKGEFIIPVFVDTVGQVAWLIAGSPQKNDQNFHMDMYEMDLETRKCSPIIIRYGAKNIDPFSVQRAFVIPYKDGIIFCDDFHGVFEVNKKSQFANLIIDFKPPAGFAGMDQAEDRYVFLRGGQLNFTFENKNEKWTKIPHPFDSLNWSHILYDSRDRSYWVSIRNEILHFDKAFQKIRSYSPAIWDMEMISSLLFDNAGNLWFVNTKQTGRLNPITGVITAFGETDGYKKQDYDWVAAAAKDAGGNIYFGGSISEAKKLYWGLDRSYPERLFQVKASRVYLDAFSVNQKPLPSPHPANSLEELFLRYNQNNIRVEGGIIDYYSRGKSKLRYKLVENGKDADWQYGPSTFSLHYEGLVPGNYKLVMQASNVDYEFIGPEKVLAFTIDSPLWEKWWFRILTASFAILFLYGFFRYRSRNLRQKNAQLEEKVLSRTKELKHSLEELRETQTQLIQREKMASLGELTAGIAHEIQNPLNFMNNFSELNAELIEELRSEQKKEIRDFKNEDDILNDIQLNEQKINHHGKRADAIVKGMLQHSRASTGVKEPTDINALADEYLRLSYHGLRAKDKAFNADMETRFDPALQAVNIVPQDIGRVLLNIYNNAFYAVHEKQKKLGDTFKPMVSVTTQLIAASGGTTPQSEIRIRDNGLGIPRNVLGKIFQPFFTTKPTGEGTGLGLSLSYDIITKMHSGNLEVETIEGESTEFIIRLPT